MFAPEWEVTMQHEATTAGDPPSLFETGGWLALLAGLSLVVWAAFGIDTTIAVNTELLPGAAATEQVTNLDLVQKQNLVFFSGLTLIIASVICLGTAAVVEAISKQSSQSE